MTADDTALAAEAALRRLRGECAAIGFDIDRVSRSLVERMQLLAELSGTFDDAIRLATHADRIFRHYEATKPDMAFSALERQTVVLASLFSDIGKTGPAEADAETRRIVVEAFGVENVRDDTQSLEAFLHAHFPADADRRIARLSAHGLAPTMTLRQFWNLHSGWTLAIAEAAGLPPEAVAAAATHHLLESVNPESIVGEDDRFTRRFGDNAAFDRAEKLVILLDKYDAVIRRGGRTHAEAIAWLREKLAKSARFHDDATFLTLLGDMDAVLGP
ncbi:MAG: hypothetical protein JST00_31420 [Deltaproteobacteria bacterium]|nr:hypothetical protein [Deltaproteobacteria bacterium]